MAFVLFTDNDKLSLRDPDDPVPFTIDFLEPQWLSRLRKIQYETQLIKRAIGASPSQDLKIWDATAGLGRDTMVLAHLGYNVIASERSEILHTLLKDAFRRASEFEETKATIARIDLRLGDSKLLLADLREEERPDVVYIDPMYPPSKKSAQPKKEMQILRKLLGPDDNLAELVEAAKKAAKKKVILKTSPRSGLDLKPKHSIESKSVRFDIF